MRPTHSRWQLAWLAPVLASVLALTLLVPTTPAQAKRPPAPAVLANNTIDAHLGYQPQSRCSPSPKPGTTALLKLLIKTWGGSSSGIYRGCGVGGTSEHKEGRALDWHMSVKSASQRKRVADALTWMTANNGEVAYRLGVMYILWNQRIWSLYYPELGWRKMASRGSATANHKDHVHISLSWDGAYQQTSWWTGVPVTQPLNSRCGTDGARACLPVIARGSTKWPVQATVVPASFLPHPWTTPAIGGSPQVGRTLTAVPGTWVPEGAALTYQWTADQKPITGADQPTFTIPVSLVGSEIRVRITATTPDAVLTKTSEELAAVYRGRFANQVVGITGVAAPGQEVRAVVGAWSPAPTKLSYRWLRNGKAIKGATGVSYRIKASDLKRKLSVRVTASTTGYYTSSALSAAVVVASGFGSIGTPVIEGSPAEGGTLHANPGQWSPQPTAFGYQWFADGAALPGANGSDLALDGSLVGKVVSVRVTATRSGQASTTAWSAGVSVYTPEPGASSEPEVTPPTETTPAATESTPAP